MGEITKKEVEAVCDELAGVFTILRKARKMAFEIAKSEDCLKASKLNCIRGVFDGLPKEAKLMEGLLDGMLGLY